MNDVIISLENVQFCYDDQSEEVLQNISLSVRSGELIVLTGDSGCGKSSLLRLINGLIPHFFEGYLKGSVKVCGRETAKSTIGELGRKVASIFQDTKSQFFTTNTTSEIVFAAQNYGVPQNVIKGRLQVEFAELGLQEIWNRDIFSLSSGQRQKVAFAGAEILNPDIYLLDEPSANLDLESILQLRRRIQALKSEGKTILIAEHRLFYLNDIADRIILLQRGQISSVSTCGVDGLPEESRHELRAADLETLVYQEPEYHQGVPLLQIDGLYHAFKGDCILNNISADIFPGEIVTIIGSNGVGKTTLCKLMAGLLKLQKGKLALNGRAIKASRLYQYSFFVMQETDYQLYTESCMSELILGQSDTESAIKFARNILQEMSMGAFEEVHPQALSGGQKQRVVIASAICSGKPILIFDEPTSGLDFKNMVTIAKILKAEAQKGKAVIVITHDIELMSYITKKIFEVTSDGMLRKRNITSQGDFSKLCQYLLGGCHEI